MFWHKIQLYQQVHKSSVRSFFIRWVDYKRTEKVLVGDTALFLERPALREIDTGRAHLWFQMHLWEAKEKRAHLFIDSIFEKKKGHVSCIYQKKPVQGEHTTEYMHFWKERQVRCVYKYPRQGEHTLFLKYMYKKLGQLSYTSINKSSYKTLSQEQYTTFLNCIYQKSRQGEHTSSFKYTNQTLSQPAYTSLIKSLYKIPRQGEHTSLYKCIFKGKGRKSTPPFSNAKAGTVHHFLKMHLQDTKATFGQF